MNRNFPSITNANARTEKKIWKQTFQENIESNFFVFFISIMGFVFVAGFSLFHWELIKKEKEQKKRLTEVNSANMLSTLLTFKATKKASFSSSFCSSSVDLVVIQIEENFIHRISMRIRNKG